MFKLIASYSFQNPLPFLDTSGYENHGNSQLVTIESDEQGEFARFLQRSSQITVPYSSSFDNLIALRIQARIWLDATQSGTRVVVGSNSFYFLIRPDHTVSVGVLGVGSESVSSEEEVLTDVELQWHRVTSEAEFSPDGIQRSIPLDKWVTVNIVHNGVSMLIFIDGELVGARYDLNSSVGSANGLQIGGRYNPIGGKLYSSFRGAITDLKLWKFDPEYREKEFFCRPMSSKQNACWRLLMARIVFLAKQKETSQNTIDLLERLEHAESELVRAVLAQGPEAIDRIHQFAQRYQRLWCTGNINTSAMQALMFEWLPWIQEIAPDAVTKYLQEIIACTSLLKKLSFANEIDILKECDTEFKGYLDHVSDGWHKGLTYGNSVHPTSE